MVTASDRSVVGFSLSGGEAHDSPEGIALLAQVERREEQIYILMDRAYEGDKMRSAAEEKGFIPVVPPKRNRKDPWEYDKERYKQRNEIERYFLRLKRFRKIFTRYDKLDVIFCGFIYFSMLIDAILVWTGSNIDEFAYSVRRHWSIENQLHWNLDVIFREDDARARKDNSPLNMNILRKTALALVNQAKYGRLSKKKMMFKAALNPQVLLDIIFPKK